jgi:hypothetical protein
VAGGGVVEAAVEVLGGDGLDGVVDSELDDEGGLGEKGWRDGNKGKDKGDERPAYYIPPIAVKLR